MLCCYGDREQVNAQCLIRKSMPYASDRKIGYYIRRNHTALVPHPLAELKIYQWEAGLEGLALRMAVPRCSRAFTKPGMFYSSTLYSAIVTINYSVSLISKQYIFKGPLPTHKAAHWADGSYKNSKLIWAY